MHRSRSSDPLKATRQSIAITITAVRIDRLEGRTDDELKLMLGTNQDCVVEVLGVPERDCYQIVHEQKKGRMVFLDTGMSFERSVGVVAIQSSTNPRTHVEKIKVFE
ncbi:tautomerase family protein [Novosphingopyxis baekryungensis]|uniref:tautomerase family protein n=1 Tax=Novosphingopyxis baekryungensis TaxID=279369 RepID=UPI001B7FE63A|nr:tautomerase family protein [Novosphingopyxis baekryungensis]